MKKTEIRFSQEDRIAVIAPHPDDECLGASAALLLAADRTDIYVLTDGSHGCPHRSTEEEAAVRKAQFEAEMKYVKPHVFKWFGYEDTKLSLYPNATDGIDFTVYTKVFLPWDKSLHPDHRAASRMCCSTIAEQRASCECFFYEVTASFYEPTHYIDISDIIDEKRRLIRFHEDQKGQEDITISLNAFRGAQTRGVQTMRTPGCRYVETYLKIDPYDRRFEPDVLIKLYTFREDPAVFRSLEEKGIRIKRMMPSDITPVYEFIRDEFALSWADESTPAMINGDCYIAEKDGELLGFSCIECTAKNFIGPAGTVKKARGLGIGNALTQTIFKALISKGYKYAIGGMADPEQLRVAGRMVDYELIDNSSRSYSDLLGW